MTLAQRAVSLVMLGLICLLGGCSNSYKSSAPPPGGPPPNLALTPMISGLSSPVDFQAPDDGTGRFFIVEQAGRVRILSNGALLSTPFLDITSKVNFSGEMGFL